MTLSGLPKIEFVKTDETVSVSLRFFLYCFTFSCLRQFGPQLLTKLRNYYRVGRRSSCLLTTFFPAHTFLILAYYQIRIYACKLYNIKHLLGRIIFDHLCYLFSIYSIGFQSLIVYNNNANPRRKYSCLIYKTTYYKTNVFSTQNYKIKHFFILNAQRFENKCCCENNSNLKISNSRSSGHTCTII